MRVGDITYLPTTDGWMYLPVLLDANSRSVVCWAIGDSLDRGLCLVALRTALQQHPPPRGWIHQTDRGAQYTSADDRIVLRTHGVTERMGRPGNCWDNAGAERFFATLENELREELSGRSRAEVQRTLFVYLAGDDNTQRLHSTLGYRPPREAMMDHAATTRAPWRHGPAQRGRR